MTTGLSYNGSVNGTNSYIQQIATLAVVDVSDPNYLIILPQMLTYAENRMYRDLDFLSTVTTNYSYTTTSSVPTVAVSVSDFVTLQQVNVITPVGQDVPNNGTRNPLLPATKEFLNLVYPSSSSAALPVYFAMLNQNTIILGPCPNATYTLELVGTYRPDSLSATNTTTFISLYLPDVFIMASMIYISAYQRNFGRANDDPQMAVTYESQYQTLLKSADLEENRKKFESAAWSSQSMATTATPSRG
jgi:hypothetical protein